VELDLPNLESRERPIANRPAGYQPALQCLS
jgi:hypothetical protein